MIAALLLLCAAALLTAPRLLVRIERLRRSPRAALFVWQSLSLSAVLCLLTAAPLALVHPRPQSTPVEVAVLVVAAAKTHKEEVERAAAALRAVDGKVLGAILNQVSTSKVDRIRYGDVKYGYSTSYGRDYVYEADEAGITSRRELKGQRRRTDT